LLHFQQLVFVLLFGLSQRDFRFGAQEQLFFEALYFVDVGFDDVASFGSWVFEVEVEVDEALYEFLRVSDDLVEGGGYFGVEFVLVDALFFLFEADQVGVLVEDFEEAVAVGDLLLDLAAVHVAEEQDGLVDRVEH
jgi:hypothetical protein